MRPNSADIRCALGTALFNLNRFDEAGTVYEETLALNARDFIACHNLAVIHQRQGRLRDAADWFRKATRIQPNTALAHLNLGTILRDLGRMDDAWEHLRRAVELDPKLPDAHMMLAWVLLLTGDFARGWAEYEWRWRCPGFVWPNLPAPLWDGSPLNGRTIVLHAEQGMGDMIQFIRYAPLVAEGGGRVIAMCPPSLQRIVARVPGVIQVVTQRGMLPPFDVWLPIMSLPLRFGTTLKTIPARIPYIGIDTSSVAAWADRLRADPPGFRVGLCWAGNRANINDANRSIPLGKFAPLGQVPGVSFYSLQLGERPIGAPPPLIDHTAFIQDFADTAAFMQHLDLIISVDTAVAHLAGALGRPVWTLLPFAPDWRWLLSRPDSPWYPSMRLFRSEPCEPWEPVLQRVCAELASNVTRATSTYR